MQGGTTHNQLWLGQNPYSKGFLCQTSYRTGNGGDGLRLERGKFRGAAWDREETEVSHDCNSLGPKTDKDIHGNTPAVAKR